MKIANVILKKHTGNITLLDSVWVSRMLIYTSIFIFISMLCNVKVILCPNLLAKGFMQVVSPMCSLIIIKFLQL